MVEVKNLFWFRHDLRVNDNIALYNCSKKEKSAAVYIYDSNIINSNNFSSLHLDFINDSLNDLSIKFKKQNSHLNIFHGESVKVLKSLINSYSIKDIYSHYEIRDLKSQIGILESYIKIVEESNSGDHRKTQKHKESEVQ